MNIHNQPQNPDIDPRLVAGFDVCREAQRWRRAVDATLQVTGLTHLQFWLLQTTHTLTCELEDAVSQRQVAAVSGAGKMTTSKIMRILEGRALVDRGPSASGTAYRVIVTASGRAKLRECHTYLATNGERLFRLVAGFVGQGDTR